MKNDSRPEDVVSVVIRLCTWLNLLTPAAGGIVAGYFLGQYYPLFSDVITRRLCQPQSQCRMDTSITYAVVGGLVGFVLSVYVLRRTVEVHPLD